MAELTAQARSQAETLVKTAIVATFNSQRLQEFSDQGVTAIELAAVIDSETTAECLGLNGLRWILPADAEDYEGYVGIGHSVPFPGPVAHWNCRSTQIPVEDENSSSTRVPDESDLRRELA